MPQNNQVTEKELKMYGQDEGLKLKVYRCPAGKLSIGYGLNLEDTGITEEEAEYLLRNRLLKVEAAAKEIFGDKLWSEFGDIRRMAFVNMIYNLGIKGFKGFTQTINLAKEKKWKECGLNILNTLWARQVGARAHRISRMIAYEEFPY